MKAFADQLACEPLLFCFIVEWASSSQKISAQVESPKLNVYLWRDMPKGTFSPPEVQTLRVSSPVLHAHNCTFYKHFGVADVLHMLSKKSHFLWLPFTKQCADVPGCQTEKLINQTTLWEILQVSETTMVRAQKKCHNVRTPLLLRGNWREKDICNFGVWPRSTVAATELSYTVLRGLMTLFFIPGSCSLVYSCLSKILFLQTFLHLLDFEYASNSIGVNCRRLILGAIRLPASQD